MKAILVVAALGLAACATMSSENGTTAQAGSCSPATVNGGAIVYSQPDVNSNRVASLSNKARVCADSDAVGFGWSIDGARFDWGALRRNRDAEIARLERIYRSLLTGSEVEIIDDRAVIEGPQSVRLVGSGRLVTAKHILIAVGGHPTLEPPIEGGELAITSNDVFELDHLPERILVVGGGYIAESDLI